MIVKEFNPFPELHTERLILRKIEKSDAEAFLEVFGDPEVAKYDYFHPLKDLDQANKYIERISEEIEEQEEITWGIVVKETNQYIGNCCIGDFADGARRAEIGYDINQKEWNKGYATEAVKAMIQYGFTKMGLNRIEAQITPGNDGSVRVLSKLGFVNEGLLRERDLLKGELVDGIMMSMLKREYTAE